MTDAAATAASDARDDEAAPLLVPHVAQRFEGIDWTWKYLAAFWSLLDDKGWLDRDPARLELYIKSFRSDTVGCARQLPEGPQKPSVNRSIWIRFFLGDHTSSGQVLRSGKGRWMDHSDA